jgi:hypothetical protein
MALSNEAFYLLISLTPLEYRLQLGLKTTMRHLPPSDHRTINAAFQYFQYNFEGFRRCQWLHIEEIVQTLDKFLEMVNLVLVTPMGRAARSEKAKEIANFIERRYYAEYANIPESIAVAAVPVETTVYWRQRFLECIDMTSAKRREAERGVQLYGLVSK